MAEIAVQFVIQKLLDFLTNQAYFLEGVHERVTSLEEKLEEIRDLLKDVHGKRRNSSVVKRWVGQIREVAYDAEDIIASYIFNIAQQRGEPSTGFMRILRSFSHRITDIPAIRQVGKKISDIETRLNEILSNRPELGIDNISASGEASSSSDQTYTRREKRAPITEEADVVGVEDETKTLVGRLIEGDVRRAVISITGMGGIGKTTLAKKVYNNVDIKKNFDFHAWVSVSQEHQLREIFLSILKSLGRNERETTAEEDLGKQLYDHLEGKKYLVVIDDIWTRDAWNGLVSAFPDRQKGSRVLLTTRNEEIAKYADAQSTPHKMHFLNESESWALFCKKALPGNLVVPCPANLEELGRKIVAKCGGLPLAIAVIGGVLSRKEKSVNEWYKVLTSLEWHLHESEDAISGILALSYHDLPYYLKPCFLYFGAFPEDSEISVDRLIWMWIAEGFVQQRGEEEMEDVAEDYLDELISRSMIQMARRKSNGTVEKCRIHDLLRDLSISEGKEERFLDVHGNIAPTSRTKARRLAITSGGISESLSLHRSTLHLRSLLYFGPLITTPEKQQLIILLVGFKLLRVMDLQNVLLSSIPDEIGHIIHLRYLRLHVIQMLPSTITHLSNLQTLDLICPKHMQLDDICKMEQIRHLLLPWGCSISKRTPLHHLSNLQTLKVGKADVQIEAGLEKLTNLRDLEVRDLEMDSSHSVCKLVRLRSLSLETRDGCSIPAFESFSNHQHLYKMKLCGRLEKFLDLHEFPPNLTELHLNGSQIQQDPMGTLEKLPNLRILTLCKRNSTRKDESYMGKEMVCSAGGFLQLESLRIDSDELEEWRVEAGAMPNLRFLEMIDCIRLKMIPDGLQHVTTLKELTLRGAAKELKARVRENEGEDRYKIQHITLSYLANLMCIIEGPTEVEFLLRHRTVHPSTARL